MARPQDDRGGAGAGALLWPICLVEIPGAPSLEAGAVHLLSGDPVSLSPQGTARGHLASLSLPLGPVLETGRATRAGETHLPRLEELAVAVVVLVAPGGVGRKAAHEAREALLANLRRRLSEAEARAQTRAAAPTGTEAGPGPEGEPWGTPVPGLPAGIPGLPHLLTLLGGGSPGEVTPAPPEDHGSGSVLTRGLGTLGTSDLPLHRALSPRAPGSGEEAARRGGRRALVQLVQELRGEGIPGPLGAMTDLSPPPGHPDPFPPGTLSGLAILGPGALAQASGPVGRDGVWARKPFHLVLAGDPGDRGSGTVHGTVLLHAAYALRPGLAAELPRSPRPAAPPGRGASAVPLLAVVPRHLAPPVWFEVGDADGLRPRPVLSPADPAPGNPGGPADPAAAWAAVPPSPPVLHQPAPGAPVAAAWLEGGRIRLVRFTPRAAPPGRPGPGGHLPQVISLPETPVLVGPVAVGADPEGRLVLAALDTGGHWVIVRETGEPRRPWIVQTVDLPPMAGRPGAREGGGASGGVLEVALVMRGSPRTGGREEPTHPDLFWVPAPEPGAPAHLQRDHAVAGARGAVRWGRTRVESDREGPLDAARGFGLGVTRGPVPASSPAPAVIAAAATAEGGLAVASAVLSADPIAWVRVPMGSLDPRHPGPAPLRVAVAPSVAVAPDGSGVAIAFAAEDGSVHLVGGGTAASPAPGAPTLGAGLTHETVQHAPATDPGAWPSAPAVVLDGPLVLPDRPPVSRGRVAPTPGHPTLAWTTAHGALHLARRDADGRWSHRILPPGDDA